TRMEPHYSREELLRTPKRVVPASSPTKKSCLTTELGEHARRTQQRGSLSAYPIGVLSDRVDRFTLLVLGIVLLLLADLVLAFGNGFVGLGIGVVLWGLHMGFTQGLLASLIAETAPSELLGTAFGVFNLITGLTLLVASVTAGALWDVAGPHGTFI